MSDLHLDIACFSSPTQDTSIYCGFRSQWLTVT